MIFWSFALSGLVILILICSRGFTPHYILSPLQGAHPRVCKFDLNYKNTNSHVYWLFSTPTIYLLPTFVLAVHFPLRTSYFTLVSMGVAHRWDITPLQGAHPRVCKFDLNFKNSNSPMYWLFSTAYRLLSTVCVLAVNFILRTSNFTLSLYWLFTSHFALRTSHFFQSPHISSFPSIHFLTSSVVMDLGRSSGRLKALSQQRLDKTPSARLTPNRTV